MPARYSYLDIINRARIYIDDKLNTPQTQGAWKTDDWLALLRPEVIACYKKWLREGLISLEWVDQQFTGPTFLWDNAETVPMCIIGVAQDMGNYMRPVMPAQAEMGRAPWYPRTNTYGPATTWTASFSFVSPSMTDEPDVGEPGKYQLKLHPPDTASNYIVRYIPEPLVPLLANQASSVKFYAPEGYDDYLALRLARKMLAAENSSSQSIERLIMQAESDMKMDSLANPMNDAPKVRIVRPFGRRGVDTSPWQTTPLNWFYF